MQQCSRLVACGFLLCEVTFTTTMSLSCNGWFHLTTIATQSLSPVSGWEFSEARYVDWLIVLCTLYDAGQAYAKKLYWEEIHVAVTQSRKISFCVKYVNTIMFAKFRWGVGGWQLLSLPVPGCVPGSHHSRPWVIGHMRPPDRFSLACESFLNYRNFCRSMIFTRLIVISIMFSKLQRNKIY